MRDLGDGFESTGSMLSGTMRRFTAMARKQNGGWMWGLVLFCVAVFMYVYFVRYK